MKSTKTFARDSFSIQNLQVSFEFLKNLAHFFIFHYDCTSVRRIHCFKQVLVFLKQTEINEWPRDCLNIVANPKCDYSILILLGWRKSFILPRT